MKRSQGARTLFATGLAAWLILGLAPLPARAQASTPDGVATAATERMKDDVDALVPPDAPLPDMVAEGNGSGDYRIDALLSGYRLYSSTITYSFYSDSVFGGQYYGSESVREVSDGIKYNVRQIMALYSTIMNLNLVEVAESPTTVGRIRIMLSSGPGYAYAYYPSTETMFHVASDVHLSPNYDRLGDTNGFQNAPGQHGYNALIHEIGHALGLKHPHDASPNLPSGEDNHSHTVMSYNFLGASPGTPMPFDLMALQFIYGPRAARGGDSTYTFSRSTVDQYSLDGALYLNPSSTTKQTIWDSGGYNVLDLSGLPASGSYRFDLNPLGSLTTTTAYQGTYISSGTCLGPNVWIQKVISSPGGDTLYANSRANVFGGYAPNRITGQDVIYGANGADAIDLSSYLPSDVGDAMSGNDRVLTLGSNGSIRLKDYYISDPPAVVFQRITPTVSIDNVSVQEGQSGVVQAVFHVTLSSPPSGSVAVDYATVDDTATAGVDYAAASGTLTFAAGETQKTIVVNVIGDTAVEHDEIFSVVLSNATGLQVGDGLGNATIVDDDVPPPPPPSTVMVIGHFMFRIVAGPAGRAVISVEDEAGQPVVGALVRGTWSGVLNVAVSRKTGAAGKATFKSQVVPSGLLTFTVTQITKDGYVFAPTLSTATSATVRIP